MKVDNDGSLWIGGVCYHPDSKVNTAIAKTSKPPPSTADQKEFPNWVPSNCADTLLDTNKMLITSVNHPETVLFSHPSGIPFFLDSGASSHISCLCSDFTILT